MSRGIPFSRWLCPFLYVLLSACGVLANSATPGDRYLQVYNYQNDWLVYSPGYDNYVPYTRSIHETETSVSLLVNLIRNRHYTLLLRSQHETFLFIAGALQKNIAPGTELSLSCDSLYRIYQEEELLLTFFGGVGIEGLSALMVFPKNADTTLDTTPLTKSQIRIKPKPAPVFRDFSVIVLLLILGLTATGFQTAPAIMRRISNPIEFFNRDFRSELYHHHRPYSPVIIMGVLILSMLLAFLLMYLEKQDIPVLPNGLIMGDHMTFTGLLTDYLGLTVLCFFSCYLKYFFILVTSRILNFSNVADFHFIKTLQSSLLFYSVLVLAFLLLLQQLPTFTETLQEYLYLPVLAFYFIRFLFLYLLINRSKRFINLYLFSYLCVIEIIPVIIGIKFAL